MLESSPLQAGTKADLKAYVWSMHHVLLALITAQPLTCRSWAGLKDHAQYWIIMGCLGGAGRSWHVPTCQLHLQRSRRPFSSILPDLLANAAGLLVLLISGRLTLSNVSPLALTLSNTYGRWNTDAQQLPHRHVTSSCLFANLLAAMHTVVKRRARCARQCIVSNLDCLQFCLKEVGHCAGLVAGVFLLGYGLVEIPRGMWNEANPEDRLRSACYRCAFLFA